MDVSIHSQMLAEVNRDIAELEKRLDELRAVARYHASKVPTANASNPPPSPETPRSLTIPVVDPATAMRGMSGVQENRQPDVPGLVTREIRAAAVPSVASQEFAHTTMKEAAESLLHRAGGALSTRQIADALLAGGYPTQNPEGLRNAAFSMLSREDGTFVKAGPRLWALKSSAGGAGEQRTLPLEEEQG